MSSNAKRAAPKRSARRSGRGKYSAESKAAVLAALLAGGGIDAVAKVYNLPAGTVKGWKSKLKGEHPVTTTAEQKADVGDLLIQYLREALVTLTIHQVVIFRDVKWLKKQDASDLAILHGVVADKAARLCEVMGTGADLPNKASGS